MHLGDFSYGDEISSDDEYYDDFELHYENNDDSEVLLLVANQHCNIVYTCTCRVVLIHKMVHMVIHRAVLIQICLQLKCMNYCLILKAFLSRYIATRHIIVN